MAKFKKKPKIVEAFQYNGDLKGVGGEYYVPDWAVEAYEDGVLYYGSIYSGGPPTELFIKREEGTLHVNIGDYVIKDMEDKIHSAKMYKCIGDKFEKEYELL